MCVHVLCVSIGAPVASLKRNLERVFRMFQGKARDREKDYEPNFLFYMYDCIFKKIVLPFT